MSKFYCVDDEKVISEQIEQDTVVINLEKGYYYDFNPTASVILLLLKNGITKEQLIMEYSSYFNIAPDIADRDVSKIFTYLLQKSLIAETSNMNEKVSINGHFEYVEPEIVEFDDMQEMLLLDPIHEVKDKGWPHKKDE